MLDDLFIFIAEKSIQPPRIHGVRASDVGQGIRRNAGDTQIPGKAQRQAAKPASGKPQHFGVRDTGALADTQGARIAELEKEKERLRSEIEAAQQASVKLDETLRGVEQGLSTLPGIDADIRDVLTNLQWLRIFVALRRAHEDRPEPSVEQKRRVHAIVGPRPV